MSSPLKLGARHLTPRQAGELFGRPYMGGLERLGIIARGTPEQIRAEVVPKLECCFEDGGFIPACDHAIPPDVSLDNYRYYRELVVETSRRMYGLA